MSARSRTTRLSSGSTKKRNYAEGLTSSEDEAGGSTRNAKRGRQSLIDAESDSEDDYKQPKKEKGKGRSSARRGNASSEEPSSEEFVDEEDEEDDEDDGNVTEEDSESQEDNHKKRKSAKSATKAQSRVSNGSQSGYNGDVSEVIHLAKAPKEPVPSNRISEHTLEFMRNMQDPRKNDRDWFAANKPVYDYCYQNWLAFTATCVDEMIDKADDTIAWMQPKDLIERIYRDVRFSNDKTPYKRHISWCMSRMGKKGPYAKYYFSLSANNRSGIHAGLYEVDREGLAAVRQQIVEKTAYGQALRELVKSPNFVEAFGPMPKSAASGKRSSLWGSGDELKRAPKGYEPDHPDAMWLRLKSYTVSHYFKDTDVLKPDFIEKITSIAKVAQPLVELMNEIIHGPVDQ